MGNSVFIAASVDGFIARKDGSLDWLTKIENPEKTDYGFQAFMDRMDAVVMGRKTFESIENFEPWPYSKPVFVLSGTLNPAEKNKPGVRIMNKSPKELVSDLNRQGLNNLYIDGGKTIQGFLTENLIDEQSNFEYAPSFLTGFYFDEIYHARTAWEMLHRIEPYETTHPPLGKLIISSGIALFGMNAFGWRIAGALFGVALVPLMYLFGLKLFRNRFFAFSAAFLMMADFMRFGLRAVIPVHAQEQIILRVGINEVATQRNNAPLVHVPRQRLAADLRGSAGYADGARDSEVEGILIAVVVAERDCAGKRPCCSCVASQGECGRSATSSQRSRAPRHRGATNRHPERAQPCAREGARPQPKAAS